MSEKYNFTVEKKGYNTDQVDNVIDDLNSKNKYLIARVAELEQKLDTARRLIRRFTDSENGLRQNIADSKRAAANMLNDTKNRSDTLLDKTRESCGEIISDLDIKIADRMNTVEIIRAEVASFKDQLFALYSSHIDMIESIASTAENFTYEPDYSKVAMAVDEFESAKDTEIKLPEFAEYPKESIFTEYNSEKDESFNIEKKEESKIEEADFDDSIDVIAEKKPEEFVYEQYSEDTQEEPEFNAEEIDYETVLAEIEEISDDANEGDEAYEDDETGEDDEADEGYEADEGAYFDEGDGDEAAEIESEKIPEDEEDFPDDISFEEFMQESEEIEADVLPAEEYEAEPEDGETEIETEPKITGDISDDEYYRFLENFINEDDGTMSYPD